MESKILNTVKAWIPQCYSGQEEQSEYHVLKQVASYCLLHFEGDEAEQQLAKEALQVIGLLYYNGSLHTKNAIENEFLEHLAASESPASLRKHLASFPKELAPVYIKTILEN
ncbi:DUF7674 family protein [Sphingobacterium sp. HJSM2_6]|uniref:DUF7674 family protein n=1 Tax=Sphingobacterium sp. HJSM2_6 TaxID=3366264 RepID=UPI003BC122C9